MADWIFVPSAWLPAALGPPGSPAAPGSRFTGKTTWAYIGDVGHGSAPFI
jgi:hypothetical protein